MTLLQRVVITMQVQIFTTVTTKGVKKRLKSTTFS